MKAERAISSSFQALDLSVNMIDVIQLASTPTSLLADNTTMRSDKLLNRDDNVCVYSVGIALLVAMVSIL